MRRDSTVKPNVRQNEMIAETVPLESAVKYAAAVLNENKIMELWSKKNNLFIGYNCRITAFDLMKDKIKVDENAKANPTELSMDQDALKNAPEKKFTKKQTATFEKLFSTLNTEYTTDVDTHVKKLQKSLKAKGVTISKKTKASLITVVFHSSFGKEEKLLLCLKLTCVK